MLDCLFSQRVVGIFCKFLHSMEGSSDFDGGAKDDATAGVLRMILN